MKETELAAWSDRIHSHLFNHILPFWCGPALDHEQGGWMGWLSNDLKPDRTQPKGLIVNCRILWTFSAVCRVKPDPLFRQMAERAFDYVMNRFWDNQHGGAYWRLDDRGHVLEEVKKVYGQSFYIYALAEFYQTFGASGARERAIQLFGLVERRLHDPANSGYFEVASRDWTQILDAPLSERDQNEKKSMNSHLHLLEAYTNLYRVWKEPCVAERLREVSHIFLERILDPRTHHLHHFFDERWSVRSDSYTFGHDIEASWLLCEAAEVLGDEALVERVHGPALQIAESVLREAVQPDGALVYEGRRGEIIDRGKECWPQAEAVVGFLNAFQLSRDVKYLIAAGRVWDFIEARLVDRLHGDWFWRINPDGKVEPNLPKVSEWKGPYHATRACLEAMRGISQPV